jgi:replication factor A1
MKSDIRKFSNARGEGQFFKIELVDKDGGEIMATFFGKAAGDRYFNFLQQHQVYYFGKGNVKPANKRFDKGDYVITFDENTQIEPAEPDDEIPGVKYSFVPLADVDRLDIGTIIDVKAIVYEARDPTTVTIRRTNEDKPKRDVVLWDDSGAEGSFIEITIWGDRAHDNFEAGAVVFGKDFRISEWQGVKSLNVNQYELNPDHPEAFDLKRKFAEKRPSYAGGPARASKMLSGARQETIRECIDADMNLPPPAAPGQPADPKSISRHFVMATIYSLPSDKAPYYAACPELVDSGRPAQGNEPPPKRQCNRKVTLEGQCWTCQSGHTCERPNHRYLFNRVQVSDHTGSMDISFFDECGKAVMGYDAEELAAIWDDPERADEVQQRLLKASYKRYVWRLKSSREVWQEETRTRVNGEAAMLPDYVKEGNRMLEDIKEALQPPAPQHVAGG